VLKLTEKARLLIKNRDLKVIKKEVIDSVVESSDDLFELLRDLRKKIAQTENVPPYVICSDKSLKEISLQKPKDLNDFIKIQGFGEIKTKKYGEKFISQINSYFAINKNENDNEKSYVLTCNLFMAGKNIEEISLERNLTITTIENHIFEGYRNQMDVSLDSFIIPENEDMILKAINSGTTGKLKEIKDTLPESFSYREIKAVLTKNTEKINPHR